MTKFLVCHRTADGPRTIVTHDLSERDASLMRDLWASQNAAYAALPPAVPTSLAKHMAAHRRAAERRAAKRIAVATCDDNVIGIRSKK